MGRAGRRAGRGGGQQAGRPLGGQGKGLGSKRAGLLEGLPLCSQQPPGTGSGWPGGLPRRVPAWGARAEKGHRPGQLGEGNCPSHLSPRGQPASAALPDSLCAHQGPVLRLPVEECSRRGPSRPCSARAWHGLRSAGTLLRISRFPGQTQLHLPSKSSLLLLLPAPPR